METMVDYDEYESLKNRAEQTVMAVFYLAAEMGRLDLLQRAGFELLINGKPIENEE